MRAIGKLSDLLIVVYVDIKILSPMNLESVSKKISRCPTMHKKRTKQSALSKLKLEVKALQVAQ